MEQKVFFVGVDREDAVRRGPILSRRDVVMDATPAEYVEPWRNVYIGTISVELDSPKLWE